jgi:hypothetical protein
VYSPGDAGFTDTDKSGYLPEAVAVLQMHLHHYFRSAFEHVQPADQKVDLFSVTISPATNGI